MSCGYGIRLDEQVPLLNFSRRTLRSARADCQSGLKTRRIAPLRMRHPINGVEDKRLFRRSASFPTLSPTLLLPTP
jgi:hypothetical protein